MAQAGIGLYSKEQSAGMNGLLVVLSSVFSSMIQTIWLLQLSL